MLCELHAVARETPTTRRCAGCRSGSRTGSPARRRRSSRPRGAAARTAWPRSRAEPVDLGLRVAGIPATVGDLARRDVGDAPEDGLHVLGRVAVPADGVLARSRGRRGPRGGVSTVNGPPPRRARGRGRAGRRSSRTSSERSKPRMSSSRVVVRVREEAVGVRAVDRRSSWRSLRRSPPSVGGRRPSCTRGAGRDAGSAIDVVRSVRRVSTSRTWSSRGMPTRSSFGVSLVAGHREPGVVPADADPRPEPSVKTIGSPGTRHSMATIVVARPRRRGRSCARRAGGRRRCARR